ncbi:hypothetical protein U9M48_031231 [Paspalum notatum var. saurae]|uniref:Transposase (putative) gypsy type domain-containing protein n=1 Tax=Paspalum notatum var. saurae TaxID=547442 RepID=A0AAQ3U4P5_PASNO
MAEVGDGIGESPLVAADGDPDRAAATTESLPETVNLEWGKAACSEESIQKLAADGVFRPGELVEWRVPVKDETPTTSAKEDQFVVLSLTHIMCGLRVDASDFLVSVLAHYGIEWSHLTPNSITALSLFAHLCEAYIGVPPTVEVFAHFYKLYHNMKGETTTLGGIYFRLKDKMRRTYPMYYLRTSQFMWNSMWFYAKLPQSCRLTFRGNALKDTGNWKGQLLLSPEQEKQVLQIGELSSQGLTGVHIVRDYLKHRISPLRRRTHLACEYTGPADPTRDSDKELSVEDIESKLSYLLDLKKMSEIHPPIRSNVPTSMVGASANEQANQSLGLLIVPSTYEAKIKSVEGITASQRIRKHSMTAYKPLGPASLRRYTRQSAGHRKIVVPPSPEIDSSPTHGLSDPVEEALEATPTAPAPSPNPGMVQKSIEHCAEVEDGERTELTEPILSIIRAKRKSFTSSSGSQRKAKYSLLSVVTKTRMPSLGSGSLKGTSSAKEAVVALNAQPQGSDQPSPVSSAGEAENSALIILANVVDQNKVEDPMSNVLPDQPVRGSPPKEVDPVQYISERVKEKETVKESALVPVHNIEEINSEVILEQMQKVQDEYVSLSAAASSKLLEQAKKLVMENKRLKEGQTMLKQQLRDLEEERRVLTERMTKNEQDVLERIEENTKLKDETRGQKQMIDELSKQNMALVQKCTEVDCLKEEAAQLIKEREELQSRVARANDLLKQMTSALCHEKGEGNRAS